MIYYIYIAYGVSSISYREIKEEIVGTGQSNIISGNACRDKSYLIIQEIEKEKIGALIEIPKLKQNITRIAVAYVNDTSLYSNSVNGIQNM